MFETLFTLTVLLAAGDANASDANADTQQVVAVGSGSYTTILPPGCKRPPETIYRTDACRGKMPTNDWWSSLAWMPYSEPQYPHPLAVRAVSSGLQVDYPGPHITTSKDAIFGAMPGGGRDLILGHSAEADFPDARVDGFSDWFVRVRLAQGARRMVVSYGHGSPFVFALYDGGSARITFAQRPRVWSGDQGQPVLGLSVGGKPYGLFGPAGSTWSGLDSKTLTNQARGKPYFSLALLPDDSAEALALFKRHAYAHVTDTRFGGSYDAKTGKVVTTFRFTTKAYEGDGTQTLFALYPHQWRHTDAELLDYEYQSVRGTMKLARGSGFETRMPFAGVLPSFPDAGACDRRQLNAMLDQEPPRTGGGPRDTYWEGKRLGKLATLIPIARQAGNAAAASAFRNEMKQRLEGWLTASEPDGRVKSRGLFYYDDRWGTLIGYPASYGSDVQLNDHHFHYGYFLRAAAELAGEDPDWAAEGRFGGMVKLLVRDIASTGRSDAMFPFLRNFDPYAGHSWAAGHAKFGDGNNQESSSEAMAAWAGMILWGAATGDPAIRDAGILLYANELAAIEEYWFDVHGSNFPPDYPASVVTMVWGGKGANATWFSANPEAVHGINWLPFHGGSLYLGRYPEYVRRNYQALLAENRGANWDQWADLVWMYLALDDPQTALGQFDARPADFAPEAGNSLANTYHWIRNLAALGQVDRTVSANHPLYAVFRKGERKTYVVYSMGTEPKTVVFSDGTRMTTAGKGFTIQHN